MSRMDRYNDGEDNASRQAQLEWKIPDDEDLLEFRYDPDVTDPVDGDAEPGIMQETNASEEKTVEAAEQYETALHEEAAEELHHAVEHTVHPHRKGRRIAIFPKKNLYMILIIAMLLVSVAFLMMLAVFNAFPAGMSLTMIIVMIAVMLLCWFLFLRKKKALRITGIVLTALFIFLFSMGTYYLGSTYAMFNRISGDNAALTAASDVDVTREAFNVYITGIDQWAKEKGLDLERSDVNMIVTVNPNTRKILLTSIPRDTYVELYTAGQMDKLTHTGVYGVEETINTVQKWLGIDLNYYVKMNFSAVRDIINAMGGIDVYSPYEFETSLWGYKIEKGWNHMEGKKAVFFARERKFFEGRDDKRVENQQRVVKACIDKLTSSTTLLTSYGDIMDAAGRNLQTNMTGNDIQALVRMQLSDLGGWDVENQKIKGEYDMDYVASLTQSQKFQVYRPHAASVRSCLAAISDVMNPTEEELEEAAENRKKRSLISFLNSMTGGNKGSDEEEETEEENK